MAKGDRLFFHTLKVRTLGCSWKKIGVVLTKLTKAQADYLNVPVEGSYKSEHCQY